jgi:hypothetical protein
VKSNPRQANVSLDKEPVSQKKISFINNSYHIDGIRPGEYLLEITSPGYRSWSKKISVHSGVSTEFWNVLLAKEEYPKTSFFVSPTGKFFPSSKFDHIAYSEKRGEELAINILKIADATIENVFSSAEYNFTDNPRENIEWSPRSDAVIVPLIRQSDGSEHYLLIDIKSKAAINLKDLAQTEDISQIRWDPLKRNIVFYLSDLNLYRLDIEHPEDKKLIAQNIASYDFSSNGVYYFQLPSGIIYETEREGSGLPEQITTSSPTDMSDPLYKVIAYDKKRIALVNYDLGKLFLWNEGEKSEYFRELSDDVTGIQFSDDGKKLLFWNDREILVYFTRNWDVQPTRLENETQSIVRFSQELGNVQWAKDYEHVIFSVGKSIKISELDHRDYRNIMDIAPLVSNEVNIVCDSSSDKLYFTDKNNGEDSNFDLFSLDFPEKEGILGF